ncbi:MAG: DUF4974 domain-containing protein [Bacteroidetes bacterium]|nr:MAG: DUF4974 domain-containing protein [Bacteroidota bacterium]
MDKYATYTVEELAADPFFMQWVRHPDARSEAFWRSWLETHPEKAETVEAAIKLVLSLKVKEQELSGEEIERMWARLEAGIAEAERTPGQEGRVVRMQQTWWYVGIAASILLLVGLLFFLLRPAAVELYAAKGSHEQLYLPDSSLVVLNADSRLRFDPAKWEDERVVFLEGEGFFEVRKGSPFVVQTPQGEVAVLGTSFNVFAREQGFSVACYTGKVRVSSAKTAAEVVLTPGMRSQADEQGQLLTTQFEPEKQPDWRSGIFTYQDAPLSWVLQEIERQYDVQLELQTDISDKKFEGELDMRNMELDSLMSSLQYLYDWRVERKGDRLLIRSE